MRLLRSAKLKATVSYRMLAVATNPLAASKTISAAWLYACIASPRNPESVSITMLTACFDASGKKEDKDRVSVAGFSAFASQWRDFDVEWSARLAKDHLEGFHAAEFAQFKGLYRHGWRNDEPRRRSLSADLMAIIRNNGLRKYGSIVKVAEFNDVDEAIRARLSLTPYVYASRVAAGHVFKWAAQNNALRNIEFVFDKGDDEDALRRCLKADGFNDPLFKWDTVHTTIKGITYDPFLGLQAADWLAYEYFNDFKLRDDRRWAFLEFEKVPGKLDYQTAETIAANIAQYQVFEQSIGLGVT